ncbi:VIT family protein [Tsukamurella sp. 1534]|uniref:VIT1/CCC1 transporter family protein n=1 Tax=Tsukamurella sp. 1534 TaxID=1151061 RepID=UPI0005924852|nr:VIT family protein [Tsukamurella sp. 1534]
MAEDIGEGAGTHDFEPHHAAVGDRLNWLRAGVLGANDGLISTAGIVIGVAAATGEPSTILTAGIAGLTAGAVSMALGEYVSVSTQRDTEKALIAKERAELREMPSEELEELESLYRSKGLTPETARKVAEELTAADPLQAHLDAELGIDQANLTNPWAAALSSAVAFSVGALIPILASLLATQRILAIVLAVLAGLALTGYVSARLGDADVRRATTRVVMGGVIAMSVTYMVGKLLGTAGIA